MNRRHILILELLADESPLYGLQLVERSNGVLKRGSIYVDLYRLEELGFVRSDLEANPDPEVGIARRIFWITGDGARTLRTLDTDGALPDFA